MAKLTVLPRVHATFEASVDKLADEGKTLAAAYADVTKRILDFARRFHDLWDRALTLDKGEENGVHRQYLMDALSDAIGTDNKSIRSRWIMIGQHASDLSPIKASLPPQRDSLYEVALALEAKKPVDKWVDEGVLTSQTSVREIRALRKPKARKKKGATSKRHMNASVSLSFATYEDAVEQLLSLLRSNHQFDVQSDKAFFEALKAKVDADEFKKIESRIR
jgi:hypothetical protein